MADASEALLRLDGVYTDIGRYQILYGVDLTVQRGRVTMLLGRNGAGKTTTLRTIMRLWKARAGAITFDGRSIAGMETPDIARLGIAYVPENMGIFGNLTVRENMLLATGSQGFAKDHLDRVLAFFPALKLKWEAAAGSLSGGQKQMLAIGRAIVEPRRLLLVDEPTPGDGRSAGRSAAANEKGADHDPAGGAEFSRGARHGRRCRGDGPGAHRPQRLHDGARQRRGAAATVARPEHGGRRMRKEWQERLQVWAPYAVTPLLVLAVLPAMGLTAWVTLTVAGLTMGMMLFLVASGLTLIFGLMEVLNFAHAAFVTVGAYVTVSVLLPLGGWTADPSLTLNLAALLVALVAAAAASGALGYVFERIIIRQVYGAPLRQILITIGALTVIEQLVIVVWGPEAIPLPKPASLRGSIFLGASSIETYRLFALFVGLAVAAAMHLVLTRTRIGLVVRAGVEDREMVQALGYRIRRVFVGVFVAGTALAGMGGMMWGQYQTLVTSQIGDGMIILVFIILIIGGLGSVGGCFIGAILVGLTSNYVGFLAPKLALGSNILLMALILLWRPRGLFPMAGH
jgi:branched-chain amino acid transport system permease protein